MDEKMKIHLMIDNSPYPMNIDREEEEIYRKAAKLIDYKLNTYRNTYPKLAPAQYWAMAALDLSVERLRELERNDTQPFAEKLEELTKELERYM
jgi:cell division protein ZapA